MIKQFRYYAAALVFLAVSSLNGYAQVRPLPGSSNNNLKRIEAPSGISQSDLNKVNVPSIPEANVKEADRKNATTIVIYHTSDGHGNYDKRSEGGSSKGGFAILKAITKKEKHPVILLDSGDYFQGTPEGNYDGGLPGLEIMGATGYQAMGVGNHEFDFGLDNLRNLARKAPFPFVAANMYESSGKRPDFVKPYVILEAGGIKIGLIGMMAVNTKTSTIADAVANLTFKSPAQEVKPLVAELKGKVDTIMVLAHDGLISTRIKPDIQSQDQIKLSPKDISSHNISIARAVPGEISVIMGGHIHNGLLDGYLDKESGTIFAESRGYFLHASRIELVFDNDTKKIIDKNVRLISLNEATAGFDPEIDKMVKKLNDKVAKEMDVVIGSSKQTLVRNDCVYDNSIGNFLTDALRDYTGTDLAFQNTLGIRGMIKPGNVTKRDMFKIFPFDNSLVTLNLKGGDVYTLLWLTTWQNAASLQVSGMDYNFEINGEGKAEKLDINIKGQPLNRDAVYTVTVPDFLLDGGRTSSVLKKGTNIKRHKVTLRDATTEQIEKMKEIPRQPKCGTRIYERK